MVRKYISEVIGDDYRYWKKGDVILIKSPTGSGKSEFIKTQLFHWCKQQRKSMLLLSNRALLYKQQIKDMENNLRNTFQALQKIDLELYQKFEKNIEDYDYVVCDECHYFFEDSSFNRETDIIYKKIKKYSEGVIILLSATPDLIKASMGNRINREYTLPSIINNYKLYRFKKRNTVPLIIKRIREKYSGEKIIYFSNNINEVYNNYKLFDNSTFICSRWNNKYRRYIDEKERKNIEIKSCFSSNLLCATTALDNGINIKDSEVKHIILDVFTPVATVQCFGRKRLLDENEHVNIFIRDYGKKAIIGIKNQAKKALEPYKDLIGLSKEEFAIKYRKKSTGKILDLFYCEKEGIYYEVNECMKDWYFYIIDLCNKYLENDDAYFEHICQELGINSTGVININENIKNEKLDMLLKKWNGKKLYQEQRDVFIDEFFSTINGSYLDARLRGYNSLNNMIKELKLPYHIESKKDWERTENRGKVYWIIIEVDGNKNT